MSSGTSALRFVVLLHGSGSEHGGMVHGVFDFIFGTRSGSGDSSGNLCLGGCRSGCVPKKAPWHRPMPDYRPGEFEEDYPHDAGQSPSEHSFANDFCESPSALRDGSSSSEQRPSSIVSIKREPDHEVSKRQAERYMRDGNFQAAHEHFEKALHDVKHGHLTEGTKLEFAAEVLTQDAICLRDMNDEDQSVDDLYIAMDAFDKAIDAWTRVPDRDFFTPRFDKPPLAEVRENSISRCMLEQGLCAKRLNNMTKSMELFHRVVLRWDQSTFTDNEIVVRAILEMANIHLFNRQMPHPAIKAFEEAWKKADDNVLERYHNQIESGLLKCKDMLTASK